ncbi:MAG: YcgJ family protein [Rhodospirillales bacterium]
MRRSEPMRLVIAAVFAAGIGLASAAAVAGPPDVFFPIKRIVCDRKARACYDYLGASVPLTRAHLGDGPATVLENRIRRVGKAWDPSHFTLSNGVDCWTEKKVCYTAVGTNEVDRATTEALFGVR